MAKEQYVVQMCNIQKRFAGIVANEDISLNLRQGEIQALLGENGAGKSTLMNILFGLYQPDSGSIYIRGQKVRISSPNVANELGIGMVHQHFKLVHNFSVTENIILGLEPQHCGWLNIAAATKQIAKLSHNYGLKIDPKAKIADLSVGMQQRVEILKMLYRNASILIFDEPTAVLTPQEIGEMLKIMKKLVAEGKSIILITHKLKEIKAVADRCTIIRRGKQVGIVQVKKTNEAEMAAMMVGRPVIFAIDKTDGQPGETMLSLNNVTIYNQRRLLAVKDISLEIKAGEILGIAGVEGNGQTELVEAIAGLRQVESGKIILNGREITDLSVKARFSAGLAHVPADRQKNGLVLDYSLRANMALEVYDKVPFARWGIMQWPLLSQYAQKILTAFDVRSAQGELTIARSLSGGNQQKAIIGREIMLDPQVLLAVQPTRGLDVGSIEYIHKCLLARREAGKAVLLVSYELDELIKLTDRIAIFCQGEIIGIVRTADTNENELGLMMTGVRKAVAKG